MCRKNLNNPIVLPCDHWGYDSILTVGENKLQQTVEIDINGQYVYLEIENVKKLVKHLNLIVKFEEEKQKEAFEAGRVEELNKIKAVV